MDATSVQVCWASSPPGPVTASAGDTSVTVESGPSGPEERSWTGLPAGATVEVAVRPAGRRWTPLGRVALLTPPPGR